MNSDFRCRRESLPRQRLNSFIFEKLYVLKLFVDNDSRNTSGWLKLLRNLKLPVCERSQAILQCNMNNKLEKKN